MRIDLSLQGFQLQIFYFPAVSHFFFQQAVNSFHHTAEAAHELSDFILSNRGDPGSNVALLHGMHGLGKQGQTAQRGAADSQAMP